MDPMEADQPTALRTVLEATLDTAAFADPFVEAGLIDADAVPGYTIDLFLDFLVDLEALLAEIPWDLVRAFAVLALDADDPLLDDLDAFADGDFGALLGDLDALEGAVEAMPQGLSISVAVDAVDAQAGMAGVFEIFEARLEVDGDASAVFELDDDGFYLQSAEDLRFDPAFDALWGDADAFGTEFLPALARESLLLATPEGDVAAEAVAFLADRYAALIAALVAAEDAEADADAAIDAALDLIEDVDIALPAVMLSRVGSFAARVMPGDAILDGRTLYTGTVDDDAVAGTEADEAFEMREGDDIVEAGGGDDLFLDEEPDASTDRYDGGAGDDTLRLFARRDEVTLERAGDGTVTVTHGPGTDVLTEVETLALDDGRFLLDVTGEDAATAYRLYAAAFARTPDEDGFRFWARSLGEGTNPARAADRFVESDEFAETYGTNPTDRGFVQVLYINVLDRLPDVAGFNFWFAALEREDFDRGDMLLAMAQSPENRAETAADTEDGFWVV